MDCLRMESRIPITAAVVLVYQRNIALLAKQSA